MIKKVVMILYLAAAVVFPVSCAPPEQDTAAEIDRLVQAYHETQHFNGAVLAAREGQVVFQGGCGLANREWDIPNRPDTKFRLGSITKQFTSAVILQLVAEDKISLEGMLSDYLQYYRKDTGERVTIHHLLTHTSGIPSYTGLPGFSQDISRNAYPPDVFVREYCSGDLEFEPGSNYRYNNSGYFILGAVIEEITGKSYEEAVRERIFQLLGMTDSGYDRHAAVLPRRADGYDHGFDGYRNSAWLDMSVPYAAGSLYSTVEDLFKWDRALRDGRVLPESMKELLFGRHVKTGNSYYGYGWVISEVDLPGEPEPLTVIGHGGGINGFNTIIERYPDQDILIVALSNSPGARLTGITGGILRILYGKAWDPPKASIAEAVYPVILEKDGKAGAERYRELKSQQPEAYTFTPAELNRLGYHLMMGLGRLDDAVVVFELNTEEYPENANAWDSLGESYMQRGDTDRSIRAYEKSLELNPDNRNARAKLEELKK